MSPHDRPTPYPQVTVVGTESEVLDFLEEYCSGDTEHALDLLETAVEAPHCQLAVTVDWAPRDIR